MFDRHDHDRVNPESSLAAALRNLPAPPAPADAWPLLARRVRRRRRTRIGLRIGIPVALAAGIALALLLPGHPLPTMTPSARQIASTATTNPSAANVAQLQSRSQRLQTWLRRLDADGAPLNGRALASAIELQDQIGLIDLQLTVARDVQTQAPLWHHRIALLQRLALLHLAAGNDYARITRNTHPAVHHAAWTH